MSVQELQHNDLGLKWKYSVGITSKHMTEIQGMNFTENN